MAGFTYSGQVMDVFTWADGTTAWDETFRAYGSQHAANLAQLVKLLELLGDQGRLRSPDQMHAQDKQIFAVKNRFGFRAYGWFDRLNNKRCFVIAHVRLKKEDKADPADIRRCVGLKKRFEEERRN